MLIFIISVAVIGYVYAQILVAPGMILEPWKNFLERILIRRKEIKTTTEIPEVLKGKIDPDTCCSETKVELRESWFYKPIVGCFLCVTGQLALWSYPFFFKYSVSGHVVAICAAILTSKLINLIIEKLEK